MKKTTIQNVVSGTPDGQAAVQHAMEESAKVMAKPTDSEQLDFVYERDNFRIPIKAVYADMPPLDKECFDAFLAQRDQQRLTAALEALPTKWELRVDQTQPTNRQTGYNECLDQCKAALTAALNPKGHGNMPIPLSPDNSQAKE